jgi:hypothetical protein
MAGNGNHRWTQPAVAVVVVVVAVFSLLGLNGSITALQARVVGIESDLTKLDEIEERIEDLQREAVELAELRNDILAAVCAANARTPRDLRRCNGGH